jgi:hypothetical protein
MNFMYENVQQDYNTSVKFLNLCMEQQIYIF